MSLNRALAGLAEAAKPKAGAKRAAPALTNAAKAAVASFVAGKPRDVCAPNRKGGARICTVKATAKFLSVDGHVVAQRQGDKMQICPVEIPDGQKGRTVANALFSALKAGVSLKDVQGGTVIMGRNANNGVDAETDCFHVRVSKKLQEKAALNLIAWEKSTTARAAATKKRKDKKAAAEAWEQGEVNRFNGVDRRKFRKARKSRR